MSPSFLSTSLPTCQDSTVLKDLSQPILGWLQILALQSILSCDILGTLPTSLSLRHLICQLMRAKRFIWGGGLGQIK